MTLQIHTKGAQAPFDKNTEMGLPLTMGVVARSALFKSIASGLKGDDPVLSWDPPITGARAFKTNS